MGAPPDDGVPTASYGYPQPDLMPPREAFTLLWQDDFDTFDETRWSTAAHTFPQNDSQFTPDNVTVAGGVLTLSLTPNPAPVTTTDDRPYLGGEVRTNEWFLYGRFETRAKFAAGSGVVSSFFTYYDHWDEPELVEDWNELDIEFLGKDQQRITFNVIHWNEADVYTPNPAAQDLTFDPSADFHEYAIEWVPGVVHFYVDGALVHSQSQSIAEHVNLQQRLMMNIWPVRQQPGLISWAGEVGPGSIPTAAQYDWVRVYVYQG